MNREVTWVIWDLSTVTPEQIVVVVISADRVTINRTAIALDLARTILNAYGDHPP